METIECIDVDKKKAAFDELLAIIKNIDENIDYEKEREEAIKEKYGVID